MRSSFLRLLLAVLLLAVPATVGLAAVTVHTSAEPQELNIGDEATITYTIQGGDVDDFQLPAIDGLTVEGQSTSASFVMNGFTVSQNITHTFLVVPNRAGNIVVPPLDLRTGDGHLLHTQSVTLHVLGGSGPNATAPPPSSPTDQVPDNTTAGNGNVPAPSSGTISVPADTNGHSLPVFDIITPKTTTAYVGESVPLRIESFISADANAQQDSLPTLVGSDFLMNDLSLRPDEQGVNVGDEEYIRDSWVTAISAPKAGDFPLQAVRDTYWMKAGAAVPNDPFGPLFGRQAEPMHREISSNKFTIHVLPLPDEGKPTGFTGAIGHFDVSAVAQPTTVGVGEPVTLRFVVSGTGNFDYVRSPALAPDAAWKTYVANAKMNYGDDETRTRGTKTFEQAVIPIRNGTLALPAADFSYFDPDKKQYVTLPVSLPPIVVTGTPAVPVAPIATVPAESAPGANPPVPAVPSDVFAPNRLAFGSLTTDLAPAYRHAWFWITQGGLALVIFAGVVLALVRPRQDPTRGLRAERQAARTREEAAMEQAARNGDAVQFFTSARRATQLRLAECWDLPPEAVTLPEIARRDPALAEAVTPLFTEADDVVYSGAARSGIDLQDWNSRVREMLQPASL
jgi:hypothetical protein